ncbi:hypothetical protein BKA82DRAFT_4017850 [Pisolithus tinctorius]|nr:hypothetical protein BKA82DRAFT_4017850 [Pisolithus tinctorius]
MPTVKGQSPERKGRLGTMRARSDENKLWGFVGRNSKGHEGGWADMIWVMEISSNSCGNGVHGKLLFTCEIWVTQISSDSCQNGFHGKPLLNWWKAGNSLINGTYIRGAACEVWVTQISSNSCQNGVHAKPLLRGCQGCRIRTMWMGGWLEIV